MDEIIAKLNRERTPTPEVVTPPPASARLSRTSTPEYEYVPPRGHINNVVTGLKHSDLKYLKPKSVYYPSVSAAEVEFAAEEVLRVRGKAKVPADYNDPFVKYTMDRLEEIHREVPGKIPEIELPEVVRLDMRKLIVVFRDLARAQELVESNNFPVDALLDFDEGNTALHLACDSCSFPIAEMLLNHGADPNRRTRMGGHTPAILAASRGDVLCLSALRLKGADMEAGDMLEDKSPLHWAVTYGHLEAVKFLIEECGVCVSKRDCVNLIQFGRSAENLAHELSEGDIERYLRRRIP